MNHILPSVRGQSPPIEGHYRHGRTELFAHRDTLRVMGVTTDGETSKELTLAFELAAVEQFTHPDDVFADAREWSRYVGVIGNDPDAVRAFLQTYDLRHDFELGDRDKWLALQEIRNATDTPRYVLIGTSQDDRLAAEQTGWEFVPLTEAAEKADWTRKDPSDQTDGIVDRLRAFIRDE